MQKYTQKRHNKTGNVLGVLRWVMVVVMMILMSTYGLAEVEAAVFCACDPGSCCESDSPEANGFGGSNCISEPSGFTEVCDNHNVCRWEPNITVSQLNSLDCGAGSDGFFCNNAACTSSSCCTPGGSTSTGGGTTTGGGGGGGEPTGGGGSPTPPPTSPPAYSLSGTVYRVSGASECSGTGLGAIQPGASSYVRAAGGWGLNQASVAGGSYTIGAVYAGTSVVRLLGQDASWIDPCGTNWTQSVSVSGNTSGINFYVTDTQPVWWQTRGGDIGAQTGDVVSSIPITCVAPACNPYLSLYDALGTVDSSGVLWYGSGIGNARYGASMAAGNDYGANSSVLTSARRESYDYFYRLFEMGLNPVEDAILSGAEANMSNQIVRCKCPPMVEHT